MAGKQQTPAPSFADGKKLAKGQYEADTRAVLRYCEPGEQHRCFWCEKWVMFKARAHLYRVICNVYVAGKWSRVEVYHAECYKDAKMPHGFPLK